MTPKRSKRPFMFGVFAILCCFESSASDDMCMVSACYLRPSSPVPDDLRNSVLRHLRTGVKIRDVSLFSSTTRRKARITISRCCSIGVDQCRATEEQCRDTPCNDPCKKIEAFHSWLRSRGVQGIQSTVEIGFTDDRGYGLFCKRDVHRGEVCQLHSPQRCSRSFSLPGCLPTLSFPNPHP